MMQTSVIIILSAISVILLFCASHLWDKVNDLEDELERVSEHGSR